MQAYKNDIESVIYLNTIRFIYKWSYLISNIPVYDHDAKNETIRGMRFPFKCPADYLLNIPA